MKVEDKFQKILSHYSKFMEIIPSAVIIHALDGSVLLANGQAALLFGYNNPSELSGKCFLNYISSQHHDYFKDNIKNAIQEGITRQVEYTFIRNDASSFSGGMSTSISPDLKDKCFVISVIADISGRKHLEKRYKAELEILSYLAETDNLPWAIQMVLFKILECTGLQAGAIKLLGGENYTFFAYDGFQKDFIDNDLCFCSLDKTDLFLKMVNGSVNLKCMFTQGIYGSINLKKYFLNEYGSFFTGGISSFLKELPVYYNCAEDRLCTKCSEMGYETAVLVPVKAGDKTLGIIQLYDLRTDALNFEDLFFLESISQPIGYVIKQLQDQEALQKSYVKMKELSAKVLYAYEEERARLARELHDEVGQALTTTKLDLQMLNGELSTLNPELNKRLAYSIKLINDTLDVVRNRAISLRPPALDDMGLTAVVRNMAEELGFRTGFAARIITEGAVESLSREVKTALYRCIQEALTNAARHADASEVAISIKRLPEEVSVMVKDNGRGFNTKILINLTGHVGLTGMKERVDLLGGKININSSPVSGTDIRIVIPLV